ncbi:MAG: hydroxymethylglutaryl-CoA lyase [Candidatus Dormibacteraeota bacterium]|nr:hydroxymethylglutaryl-CoA lyase [Candidatus Dormibacteraeota bacterium]
MGTSPGGMHRLHFTEVGPRDGLQNLDRDLPTETKLALVERLLDADVDLVEVTSMVSPRWVPKMADAELLLSALVTARGHGVLRRLRVLVPNVRGLERALAAGAVRVVANLGATEGFNRANLRQGVGETLAELERMADLARAQGCAFDVGISCSFGCPFEGQVAPDRVAELVDRLADLGVSEIGIADTIGVADPRQVSSLIEHLARSGVGAEQLSLHLHDTRGMGLANALAAYESGILRFEGSVGGIGGCPFAPRSTGNVCSEDLLHMLVRVGADSAVDLEGLCQAATYLEEVLERPLPGRLYRAGIWERTGSPA